MASYFEEPDHSGHEAGPNSDLVSAIDITQYICPYTFLYNYVIACFSINCIG